MLPLALFMEETMARRMTVEEVKDYAERLDLTVGELFLHCYKTIHGFTPRNGTVVKDTGDFYGRNRIPVYVSQYITMRKEPSQMPLRATL